MKGQAVFYATTLDESPDAIDYKTQHISEPVIKGTKLVANVHVYEFNFVKAEAWRCFEPREIPEPTPDQQQAIPGAQQQQQQQPKQIVPGLRTDI